MRQPNRPCAITQLSTIRCATVAIRRALRIVSGIGLDVRLVSYGTPSREILQMAKDLV